MYPQMNAAVSHGPGAVGGVRGQSLMTAMVTNVPIIHRNLDLLLA